MSEDQGGKRGRRGGGAPTVRWLDTTNGGQVPPMLVTYRFSKGVVGASGWGAFWDGHSDFLLHLFKKVDTVGWLQTAVSPLTSADGQPLTGPIRSCAEPPGCVVDMGSLFWQTKLSGAGEGCMARGLHSATPPLGGRRGIIPGHVCCASRADCFEGLCPPPPPLSLLFCVGGGGVEVRGCVVCLAFDSAIAGSSVGAVHCQQSASEGSHPWVHSRNRCAFTDRLELTVEACSRKGKEFVVACNVHNMTMEFHRRLFAKPSALEAGTVHDSPFNDLEWFVEDCAATLCELER